MKLTRSQRLFVALGRLNSHILSESAFLQLLRMRVDEDEEPEANREHKHRLKQLRARRKRLLREALAAYETEKLVAQASAYERGFCAGRRIK